MTRTLLLLLLLLAALAGRAQQPSYQLSGFVSDAATGEKIEGAYVYVSVQGAIVGISSNAYGFYSLRIPKGTWPLQVSMLGYHPHADSLRMEADRELLIGLRPKNNMLQEVVIQGGEDAAIIRDELDHIRISRATLLRTPRFGGEADAMKTLQLLPGIKQGAEGSAGLHVRGGSPDQNLMLLDGVPVYNMYHAFGYLSVFNPEAIRDVKVYKSGISSRYEGRLSSVIDISLREGDLYKKKKSWTFSPIASSMLWEGPLKEGKSSYIISARRTWLDALLNLGNAGEPDKRGYVFNDLSGKMNFLLNDKNRLFISAYTSTDRFYDKNKDSRSRSSFGFRWGNQNLVGRHIYQVSPTAFVSNLLYYSRYQFRQVDAYETETHKDRRTISSHIQDLTARSQLEYFPNNRHKLVTGLETGLRWFRPEVVQTASGQNEISSHMIERHSARSLSLFVEDQIQVDRTEIMLSSRQTFYSTGGKHYLHVQPHALLSYRLRPELTVKGAYDNLVQYLHLLTNSTMGQPTDLWVPATETIAPQRSQQLSLGASYSLANGAYTIGLEGYLKHMANVVEYKEGANYLYDVNTGWEGKVVAGEGVAKGVEVLMRKNKGTLSGWLAYTLANSSRQFAELNRGEPFPYKYDRTHDLSLVGIWDLNRKNQFSATFTYHTGNAMTLPVASAQSPIPANFQYTGSDRFQDFFTRRSLYTARNNYRMPAYHRADISYHHIKETKKGRTRSWIISVYNTYNRLNPYFIYEREGKIRQYAFFPIIPSVAYKLEFK